MEVPQETPCVAILNKQKCHFFFLSLAKSENRACLGRLVPVGGGRRWRKAVRG
jgi:hypothetical protein